MLIALRWLPPRPPAARIFRQPGAVACLAIAGTIAANLTFLALEGTIHAATRRPDDTITSYSNWTYWAYAVESISMGVGGAWAALALGGRWRPEKSWIDRTGIALGLYWIATYAVGFFYELIDFLLPCKG